MGRRKKGGLDEIASMPWPMGIIAGIVAFILLRHGVGAFVAATGVPVGQQLDSLLTPLAWIVMLACWVAAGASWLSAKRRKSLHDTRNDLDSLTRISWREFEMLVGESFRREGYQVLETGLGGKDGGIDLVVSKVGRRELVQCKQWKRRQVGASTVREMWGLVAHHGADAVHIVSVGDFTSDARQFADGKPIHLITGRQLLERIRSAQPGASMGVDEVQDPPHSNPNPTCPICDGTMVTRCNRRSGEEFWGCANFPQCRGTR